LGKGGSGAAAIALCAVLVLASFGTGAQTRPKRTGGTVQDGVRVWNRAPSGDGMAAFYQARGFPPEAIAEIRSHCLLTFGLHNQRADKIWLDLKRWRFQGPDGRELQRVSEADWRVRWNRLGLAAGYRATFRWTQLPEQRDLHPDEPVGGNLALPRVDGPIQVTARFATGPAGQGDDLVIRFEPLQCGPA
jgi:hypothetical protein